MSASVKGKTKDQAGELFESFHNLVMGDTGGRDATELGSLGAFAGVSEYPARVKCATLAWHTLKNALDGEKDSVSTE
jgi:nitrogen fixation NifU-like protein